MDEQLIRGLIAIIFLAIFVAVPVYFGLHMWRQQRERGRALFSIPNTKSHRQRFKPIEFAGWGISFFLLLAIQHQFQTTFLPLLIANMVPLAGLHLAWPLNCKGRLSLWEAGVAHDAELFRWSEIESFRFNEPGELSLNLLSARQVRLELDDLWKPLISFLFENNGIPQKEAENGVRQRRVDARED